MTKIFTHSRPVPEEWPGLMRLAERVTPKMATGQETKLWPSVVLGGRALLMSKNRLFANYYYGLGEVMTGMRQILEDEAKRTKVVNRAAGIMLLGAIKSRKATIPPHENYVPWLGDIFNERLKASLTSTAREAQGALSPHKSHLVEGLQVAIDSRRAWALSWQDVFLTPWRFQASISDQRLAKHISNNALLGASRVMAMLVTGWDGKGEPSAQQFQTPLTPARIELAAKPDFYNHAARTRLDEFHTGLGWTEQDGAQVFDKKYLDSPPPPLPPPTEESPLLHSERHECPAIRAGGLVTFVSKVILPDIIRTSYTLVPAKMYPTLYNE